MIISQNRQSQIHSFNLNLYLIVKNEEYTPILMISLNLLKIQKLKGFPCYDLMKKVNVVHQQIFHQIKFEFCLLLDHDPKEMSKLNLMKLSFYS